MLSAQTIGVLDLYHSIDLCARSQFNDRGSHHAVGVQTVRSRLTSHQGGRPGKAHVAVAALAQPPTTNGQTGECHGGRGTLISSSISWLSSTSCQAPSPLHLPLCCSAPPRHHDIETLKIRTTLCHPHDEDRPHPRQLAHGRGRHQPHQLQSDSSYRQGEQCLSP